MRRLLLLLAVFLLLCGQGALALTEPGSGIVQLGDVHYVVPDTAQAVPYNLTLTVQGHTVDTQTLESVSFPFLEGATFAVLTRSADGLLIPYPDDLHPGKALVLTSGNGPISLHLSTRADLYLQQTAAPEGYLFDDTPIPLPLPAMLTVINETPGLLSMEAHTKTLDNTGQPIYEPLLGRSFTLTGPDSAARTLTTDADGRLLLALPAGEYSMDGQKITIQNASVSLLTHTETEPTGRIRLTTNTALTMKLADAQGKVLTTVKLVPGTPWVSAPLPAGEYLLTCNKFPDTHQPPEPQKLTIAPGEVTEHAAQATALPLLHACAQTLRLQEDGTTLPRPDEGVHLQLKSATTGHEYALRTDSEGVAHLHGESELPTLPAGTYTLSATGYEAQTFELRLNETAEVALQRKDPEGLLLCEVIGYGQENQPLAGVALTLTGPDSSAHKATTDAQGRATFPRLVAGQYTIAQAEAPEGYVIDTPVQAVAVQSGQATRISLANSAPGWLSLSAMGIALDAQGVKRLLPLSATFTVYAADDVNAPLQVIQVGSAPIRLPASAKGTAYLLRPVDTPQGFLADPKGVAVAVYPGRTALAQALLYSDRGTFTFSHVLSGMGRTLPGGVFELCDASGAVCLTFSPDASGQYAATNLLSAGEYTVRLSEAAPGTMYSAATENMQIVPLLSGLPAADILFQSETPPASLTAPAPLALHANAQRLAPITESDAEVAFELDTPWQGDEALPFTDARLRLTLEDGAISTLTIGKAHDRAGKPLLAEIHAHTESDGWQIVKTVGPLNDSAALTFEDLFNPVTALEIVYRPADGTETLGAGISCGKVTLRAYAGRLIPQPGGMPKAISLAATASHTFEYATTAADARQSMSAEAHGSLAVPFDPGAPYTPAQLYGRVYEEKTPALGLPLVTVRLTNEKGQMVAETVTDAHGAYRFDHVPKGIYAIACDFGGLESQTNGLFIMENENQTVVLEKTPLECALVAVRPASLSGQVTMADGTPPLTRVLLTAEGQEPITLTTDTEGRFQADSLVPSHYTVSLNELEGYLPTQVPESIELPYGGEVKGLQLGITRAATLQGRIMDETNGQPVASLTLTLTNTEGRPALIFTTDNAGQYTFSPLLPGEYRVQLSLPEDRILAERDALDHIVTLQPGEMLESMDFSLIAPITLSVRLTDGSAPLANTALVLMLAQGDKVAEVISGADGVCLFENLYPGDYRAEPALPKGTVLAFAPTGDVFTYQGADTVGFSLQTPGQTYEHTLALVPSAELTGQAWRDADDDGVLTQADAPLSGVQVTLHPLMFGEPQTLVTGADGVFTFERLVPGDYRVSFSLPDGLLFARNPPHVDVVRWIHDTAETKADTDAFTLAPGQRLRNMRVGAVAAGSIFGKLWADADGDGLRGAKDLPMPGVPVVLHANGTAIAETSTDEMGAYQFGALRVGEYTVSYKMPEGYISLDTAQPSAHLRVTSPDADLSFGMVRTAALTGNVFFDRNADGTRGDGEEAYAELSVQLEAMDGTRAQVIAQAQTDAQGHYQFDNLRPGHYRVRAALSADQHAYTTGLSEAGEGEPVHLLPGDEREADAIGVVRLGQISGCVFVDEAYSGVHQGAERMLSGIHVALLAEHGQVLAETSTNRAGEYAFTALKPGNYRIRFTVGDSYVFTRTLPDAPTFASDVPEGPGPTGETALMALPMGESLTHVDAGVLTFAAISGTAWIDADGDGLHGTREDALPRVIVQLISQGDVIAQMSTDAQGQYAFDTVTPGTYSLAFQLPGGMVFTNAATRLGSILTGIDNAQAQTDAFPVTMGAKLTGQNIGALSPGEIYGTATANGQPFEGLHVELLRLEKEQWLLTAETFTDAQGHYHFDTVRPGTLSVRYALPDGWMFADPPVDGAVAQTEAFPLSTGEMREDLTVALTWPAAIAGGAYVDAQNDGVAQAPLAGVRIECFAADESLRADILTGADGQFHQNMLRPGDYTLRVTLPEGYVFSEAAAALGFPPGGTSADIVQTLAASETFTRLTIGALRPGRISGRVWEDVNVDGLDSGSEPSVPGALVVLLDGTGATVQEAAIGEDGRYAFAGLMPGDYTVRAMLPPGFLFTAQMPNGSRVPTSDQSAADLPSVRVDMGAQVTGQDAGAVRTAQLGDFVWIDENGNGLQDDDEPGLADLALTALREVNGEFVSAAQMQTDSYGYYLFENLRPGNYRLRMDVPTGYLPTQPRHEYPEIDSELPWEARITLTTAPLTLASHEEKLNCDIGIVPEEMAAYFNWEADADGMLYQFAPAPTLEPVLDPLLYAARDEALLDRTGLGGYLYIDVDGNGTFSADDIGMPDLELTLLAADLGDNTVLEMTLTDADGLYVFEFVTPGAYRLRVTLPESLAFAEDGTHVLEIPVNIGEDTLLRLDRILMQTN